MTSHSFNGVPITHSLSPSGLKTVRKLISDSRAATSERMKALTKAVAAGDEAGMKKHANWLLKSPEALLTSAVAANRKLKPSRRQSLETCMWVSMLTDFTKPIKEPVPVHPKKKPSGGFRAIQNPRIIHRTAQDAITRAMGVHFKPRSFQFTQLGLHKAIAETKKWIKAGYVFAARLDIKDFYSTFSAEALINGLPLPKEVVANAVIGRYMKVEVDQDKRYGALSLSSPISHILLNLARLGIPHGSGCSPIIGMYCVSHLVWVPIPGVMLINYADDFLLLAKSEQLRDEAVGKLTGAVADLPGGHFELKLKKLSTVMKGIEFLGHHLRIVDGQLKTNPMQPNLEYVLSRLNAIDNKLGNLLYQQGNINKAAVIEQAAKLIATARGFASAFRECDHRALVWLTMTEDKVAEACKILEMSPQDIEKAIQPWMTEKSGYAFGL